MRRSGPAQDGFKRLAVRWVRQRTPALLTVALLSIPLGFAVLSEDRPRDPRGFAEPPPQARASSPRQSEQLSPQVAAERARVARLSCEATPVLVGLLREGDTSERLIAANVLWARGQRAEVETAAQESQDRVLLAKVTALRQRRRG